MVSDAIYLGRGESEQYLLLKSANRHGLVAGATGTGKTVSLQGMVEGFSASGVPVFLADVKGDLAGLARAGADKEALLKRAADIGYTINYQAFPVIFWDIFGKAGHPVRTTVSEMGPLLLAQLLQLNDTQEGVLNIAFAVADSEGLLLLDMDDLRAMLTHISENASEYSAQYGNVAPASVAAIQRALLTLEQQGGKNLFGEPALNIFDFMKQAPNGFGAVNVFDATALMQSPKLYASFMLWLMSELFEDLPEVGDVAKPKLVFFFDEAHLLFSDAPKSLIEKIEQLVKLIRSKGVGIYFITQNPADIPEEVLAQLGNRIQHALRAYTPQEQKAIKAAAASFRVNPKFKTETAITELAIGEALVSTLDAKGVPSIVEKTLMRPPSSRLGTISSEERADTIAHSPLNGVYEQLVNRESAYEILGSRAQGNRNVSRTEQAAEVAKSETSAALSAGNVWGTAAKTVAKSVAVTAGGAIAREAIKAVAGAASGGGTASTARRGRPADGFMTSVTKNVVRNVGASVGRQIARGLLNTMLKG